MSVVQRFSLLTLLTSGLTLPYKAAQHGKNDNRERRTNVAGLFP